MFERSQLIFHTVGNRMQSTADTGIIQINSF